MKNQIQHSYFSDNFFINCLLLCFIVLFAFIFIRNNGYFGIERQDKIDVDFLYDLKYLLENEHLNSSEIDNRDINKGLTQGLLSSFKDPYTVFFDKKETDLFWNNNISSQLEGIGVEIGFGDGVPTVISPLEGSPAREAGLLPKDIIISIDGVNVKSLSSVEVASKLRGEKGTNVNIGVLRGEENVLYFDVVRDVISVPSVEHEEYGDIFYINLLRFSDATSQEFQDAIYEIDKQKTKSIILDVRYNPGGLLDSSIDVLGYFFEEGTNVAMIRNNKGEITEYKSEGTGELSGLNIVILQNGGSGSASEVVSIAMRELYGAIIIGENSFGKNVVQKWINLSNGSSIQYTFAEWLSPNSNKIPKSGIEPDIKVLDIIDTEEDEQLDRALNYLENL